MRAVALALTLFVASSADARRHDPPAHLGDAGIPVLNLDSDGRPLTFPRALTGPHSASWFAAAAADLTMLFRESGCLVPALRPSSRPTYFKQVVKEKLLVGTGTGDEPVQIKRRVRGEAGGDRVTAPYS